MIIVFRQRPRYLVLIRQLQHLIEIPAFMPRVEIGIRTRIVLDPVGRHQPNIGVTHNVLACHFYAMVLFSFYQPTVRSRR